MTILEELKAAIHSNNSSRVSRLICQIDPAKKIENDKTPIQLARDLSHWDCVEAIAINRHADPDDINKTKYGDALLYAVVANRINTVRLLLETGAPKHWYVIANGDRCLHAAVRNNNETMLALLLSFDCDVNVKNNAGQTPAELAKSLNSPSFDEGLKIFEHIETLKTIVPLTLFAQAKRQSSQGLFGKLPKNIIESCILPFLSLKFPKKNSLSSTEEFLNNVSANCFIKHFGIFPPHATRKLVKKIKNNLKEHHCTTEATRKAVSEFLGDKKDKDAKTLELLGKYKLK